MENALGPEIRLENVTVYHGEKTVVDDVTVTLNAGRTTVILGASGSGKSVLLKVAGGLLPPERGRATVGGRSVYTMSERENAHFRRNSGFVFQDAALWANNTLMQNMTLPLRFHYPGKEPAEIESHVRKILGRIGFSENLSLRPSDASTGERKIVSFVRAVSLDPGVLYLDEPIAGIHHQVSERIIELLLELKKHGRTIVIVTHDPVLTSRLADRLIVMQNGRVLESGEVTDIARSNNPAVVDILTRVLSQASTFDGSILDILDSNADI